MVGVIGILDLFPLQQQKHEKRVLRLLNLRRRFYISAPERRERGEERDVYLRVLRSEKEPS